MPVVSLRAMVVSTVVLASGCATTREVDAAGPAGACAPLPASSAPLELVVLGSGGPRSFGRAGSASLVRVGGVPRLLVDAGPGASVRLGSLGVELEALDTILLTHLHVDHAGDLPAVVKGRDLSGWDPLRFRVFGPGPGGDYPSTSAFVEGLFGAEGVFRYLPRFRNPLSFDVRDVRPTGEGPLVLLDEDGLRVSAIAVDHGDVPALAYRVEAGDRSVVVSGDLGSRTDAMVAFARGADLLLYDAAVLDPPAAPEVLYELHTSPARIGEVAASAGVGHLVLTHLTPPVEANEVQVLDSIRRTARMPVTFARDCQPFGLP